MTRAVLLLAIAAAVVLPAQARADGDPASDYLIQQQVFLPYDAKIPKPQQDALLATVRSVNTQGFKVRVALIWSDYDLGSVTSLWKQPRRYARFLGFELGYYYSGRLLVVMPNGFGFNWPKHPAAPAYATLAKVRIDSTPAGMAAAAKTAVEKLASAAGVDASASVGGATTTATGDRNRNDRVTIAIAVLAALLLGGAARLAVRRRAARRP
jgi:hypothetical protein